MRNRMLRRFGAFVAAGALAMSLMAAPAMAVDGGGTGQTEPSGTVEPAAEGENIVVVRKAVPSAKYDLYKLLQLDAEIGEKDGKTAVVSYRYSYDAALEDIISDVVAMKDFKYDAARGYGFKAYDDVVVFIAPEDKGTEDGAVKALAAAFADEMRPRIEGTEGMEPVASATAPDAGEDLVVSFKNIPDGYWMVASNAGARSIVFTTPGEDGSKTMAVKEKNPAPHVTKEVWDKDDYAAGGSWRGSNDAAFGDEMDFRITVELYNGSENIRIHDEMCEGLTFGKIKNG